MTLGSHTTRLALAVVAGLGGVMVAVAVPLALLDRAAQPPDAATSEPSVRPTAASSAWQSPLVSPWESPSESPPEPPTPTPAPPSARTVADIPADFPLRDGYPTDDADGSGSRYGRHGPNRDAEHIALHVCGHDVAAPVVADQLFGSYANYTDFRNRRLAVFPDVDAADRYLDGIEPWYSDCSDEPDEHGFQDVARLLPCNSGDRCAVGIQGELHQGSPTTAQFTMVMVRVGAAILLSQTAGEGGFGTQQHLLDKAREDEIAIAGVVAAMTAKW